MSRQYNPDPQTGTGALAGRVDQMERHLAETRTDVQALGRGISDLTATVRQLATTPTSTAAGQDGDEDEEEGQRDWFTVTDPETARAWLVELAATVTAVLTHHGITLHVPCWSLHPDVVADLLALTAERAGAYTGPRPTPVSEWLTRWLPATTDRVRTALGPCLSDRGHRHAGITYDTTGFDPISAGTWWATNRHTPAPDAFALTRLT